MHTSLKSLFLGVSAALALASAASADDRLDRGAQAQLAASAGISLADAEQLTLTELAALKFNRSASASDGQKVRLEPGRSNGFPRQLAAAADLGAEDAERMSLTEIAAHFFSEENQHTVSRPADDAVVSAREQSRALSAGIRQLAAHAGLSEAEARSLSLRQIAAHVFNRGASSGNWQRTDLP